MNTVERTLQMQLNYRPNERKGILDYPGGPNLIIWASAGGRWRGEADRKWERLKAFEGEGHMVRSAGSLKELKRALADNQQRDRDLSPETSRNWILPPTWMSLKVSFPPEPPGKGPSWPAPWFHLLQPKCKNQSDPPGFLTYRAER